MLERLTRHLGTCCCCTGRSQTPQEAGYTPIASAPTGASDRIESGAPPTAVVGPQPRPPAPAAPSSSTPTPAAGSSETAPQVASSGTSCRVTAHALKPWRDNKNAWHADLHLDVSNVGHTPLATGWTLAVDLTQATGIAKPWNWSAAMAGPGRIEGTAPETWEALAPGQTANLGSVVHLAAPSARLTGASLNGERCLLLRA